ncbi:hypothetical protein ES705_19941 [subsurface metagenome]
MEKSLAYRKQEALKHLNSAMEHLGQIPTDVWVHYEDVFKPVLTDLSALRWEIAQIDKISKQHGNTT